LESVGVTHLPDILKDPVAEARFVQVASQLTPDVVLDVLKEVPQLGKALNRLVATIAEVGKSLEETKRLRWQVLQAIAKADKLSAEQILEAMRIIDDIEKRERIDWTTVFKQVAQALALVVGLPLLVVILVAGRGGRSET